MQSTNSWTAYLRLKLPTLPSSRRRDVTRFEFIECKLVMMIGSLALIHYSPTLVSALFAARLIAARSSRTSGRISSSRFDRDRISTTAISNAVRSCCFASFRSTVIKASNSFSANASRSPFLMPAQPCRGTVVTECSARSRARRRSTHSSSRMELMGSATSKVKSRGWRRVSWETTEFQSSHRPGKDAIFRLFKKRNHLLARYRRESLEKVIDRIAAFQVINQVLNRNTRPGETWCAAHNLWINLDDRLAHVSQFSCETTWRASPLKQRRAPSPVTNGSMQWSIS
jgi:hypothetical protein